mmetsp:Transcript_7573/g.18210  ORF Transcript_7573/g.18210 Transcript_7573/m.18210 type:complete len:210 (-) Transcript_7573:192-821(-)
MRWKCRCVDSMVLCLCGGVREARHYGDSSRHSQSDAASSFDGGQCVVPLKPLVACAVWFGDNEHRQHRREGKPGCGCRRVGGCGCVRPARSAETKALVLSPPDGAAYKTAIPQAQPALLRRYIGSHEIQKDCIRGWGLGLLESREGGVDGMVATTRSRSGAIAGTTTCSRSYGLEVFRIATARLTAASNTSRHQTRSPHPTHSPRQMVR